MKKLNIQKVFWFISFLFILSCCIFYGTRFLKLYLENKKVEIKEENSLIKVIRENNAENENFQIVNGQNYFTNNDTNNYLEYSNIMWRIIKVNSDNSITAIADNSLTSLAFGKNLNYEDSQINKWLNNFDEEYTGILENSLNEVETYLQKTSTCIDTYNEITNTPCSNTTEKYYLSLLSIADYLNIGSKDSYLNNDEFYYLSSTNDENKIWYINDDGEVSSNSGTDILGIKPVITIKANIDYVSGDGTKDNPYKIEKENNLFGAYVKLDDDIWRIYQVNETEVRLMLNNYLQVSGNNLTYNYSKKTSYYDDYSYGSIAYYLNHTFLNSLSYKDKIKEVYWPNGYYNSDNNYDYTTALNSEINSKVALMSIGNIFLNSDLTNYSTMTGSAEKGNYIYVMQSSNKIYTRNISGESNIIPTISIEKELLTKGNGTYDNPYEME